MTSSRRRFSVTIPDWGQDHLSSDAVVAYVDNELADGPFTRASRHISECPECAAQVVAQGQARSALRSAGGPSLPSQLLNSLRSIPQDTELPLPPAGLAMTSDGQLVSVLRPDMCPAPREHVDDRRADMAARALPVAAPVPAHGRRPPSHRRMRFGAGAAVSGLALGAIALGATGAASGPPSPAAVPDRGVFQGSLLGGASPVADARLRLTPTGRQDDPTGTASAAPTVLFGRP